MLQFQPQCTIRPIRQLSIVMSVVLFLQTWNPFQYQLQCTISLSYLTIVMSVVLFLPIWNPFQSFFQYRDFFSFPFLFSQKKIPLLKKKLKSLLVNKVCLLSQRSHFFEPDKLNLVLKETKGFFFKVKIQPSNRDKIVLLILIA